MPSQPRSPVETTLLLGAIADDFTGATDVANNLARQGMRVVQVIGVPSPAFDPGLVDAVVVALKSRSIAAADAVSQSLQALAWLRGRGCQQVVFKYCSTFDSTDAGNIGPVADALLRALDHDFALVCPAFPENRRTVYKGYLFAGDVLLNESGMENHPLNPMRDANLLRVLARQTDGRVGLVPFETVSQGVLAARAALDRLRADGYRYAVADVLEDAHLHVLAEAVAEHPLVTGGSGIALGLPENFRRAGRLGAAADAADLGSFAGPAAVLSGSCSRATLGQVAYMRERCPAFALDALSLAEGQDQVAEALQFAREHVGDGPVLIYASADRATVKRAQDALGVAEAGSLIESALAAISRGLVEQGVRRLVVAGGETSGAVVSALGVNALRIGRQIDPGVPWTATTGSDSVALALKSGNFGGEDFFLRAFQVL